MMEKTVGKQHPALERPEAMIFDMDGTLFKTETILIPAFQKTFETLRVEDLYLGAMPPVERIIQCLGMVMDDIWRTIMSDASDAAKVRANECFIEYEVDELVQGKGELYDGVANVLQQLKRDGIKLFVASNGLEAYVKEVAKAMNIDGLFEGLYSAGEFQTSSKVDLVKLLLESHNVHSAWMVGDRASDVEAGKENNLITIGCDYANFSKQDELKGCDVRIQRFSEILILINHK
jgi:phosphoglycolate phosphatase-like HAD superfamily hydrolase